ncbi:MAG: sulfite exporter TauE/SafE family protein [Kofleriaceae bacterium]|nr:sulfite exporter TauE/SafE family protein [Kofleriaceae bacterium]
MLIIGLVLAFVIGVTLGLLGGGGAILTVPMLHYVIDLPVDIAIAASLIVVGLTSAFATINHGRHGRVQWRVGIFFGAASMLSAYGVGKFAKHIPPTIRLLGFALVMAAAAYAMLRGAYAALRASQQAPTSTTTVPPPTQPNLRALIPQGLLVGALTGAVGAGGGFLIVPALTILANMPMHHAVGTSLFVIALNSVAGFVGSGMWDSIPYQTIAGIVALAIAGSVVGSRISQRISPSVLREGFGWFIVVMASFIAAMEGPRTVGLNLSGEMRGAVVAIAVGVAGIAATVIARRVRTKRVTAAPPTLTV